MMSADGLQSGVYCGIAQIKEIPWIYTLLRKTRPTPHFEIKTILKNARVMEKVNQQEIPQNL